VKTVCADKNDKSPSLEIREWKLANLGELSQKNRPNSRHPGKLAHLLREKLHSLIRIDA